MVRLCAWTIVHTRTTGKDRTFRAQAHQTSKAEHEARIEQEGMLDEGKSNSMTGTGARISLDTVVHAFAKLSFGHWAQVG